MLCIAGLRHFWWLLLTNIVLFTSGLVRKQFLKCSIFNEIFKCLMGSFSNPVSPLWGSEVSARIARF